MPCDSTTSIERFLIRRKLTGSMDGSLLQNGEFVYGDTETSLFVKAPTGSTVYEYGRLNDTLSVNTHNTWSNEYTKDYIDGLIIVPVKSILLTAGGIAPTPTDGCTEPYVAGDGDTPVFKVVSDFTSGSYGFWNISIPGDYTGNISKVTVLYSSDSTEGNSCEWSISARVLSDDDDIDTGGTWSTVYDLVDTPDNDNRLEKIEITGNINLFGTSSNQDNFACIRLKLESGTGTFKLLQVKLEY